MPDWDENSPRLQENLAAILVEIVRRADDRVQPSLELARAWQRDSMRGLEMPDERYGGAYRGEPGLEGVGVRIGDYRGVGSTEVAEALRVFEDKLLRAIAQLDEDLPAGQLPDELNKEDILDLCA